MGPSPLRRLSEGWYTEVMLDEWFCEIAGREIGPLLSQQLATMAAKGQVLPTDRVRHGATGNWTPAEHVKGLFVAQQEPQSPAVGPASVHVPPLPSPSGLRKAKALSLPPVGPPIAAAPELPEGAGLLDIVAGPAGGAHPAHGGKITAELVRAKQKRRRQMLATGATVVVAAGVLIVCLVWAAGGFEGIKQGGGLVAVAKKTATLATQPKEPKGDAAKSNSKEKHDGGKAKAAGAKQADEKPPDKTAEEETPAEKEDEDDGKWVDASMSCAVVDQIPIKVLSAAWEGRKIGTLEGAYLAIRVEVENASRLPDSRLAFEGWSPDAPRRWVRLTDDRRKVCPAKEADPANTVANLLPLKLGAGKSAHDVLLFEAPKPAGEVLAIGTVGGSVQEGRNGLFQDSGQHDQRRAHRSRFGPAETREEGRRQAGARAAATWHGRSQSRFWDSRRRCPAVDHCVSFPGVLEDAMQNAYVADVGDFGKYGLLRTLTNGMPHLALGVVWYFVAERKTEGNDGKHDAYLSDLAGKHYWYESCDPLLYAAMKRIRQSASRSVVMIEESPLSSLNRNL